MEKFVVILWASAALTPATDGLSASANRQSDTYQLQCRRSVGQIERVEAALEVNGHQKVVQQSKVKRFKMSVQANVTYDESVVAFPRISQGALRSIRYYTEAAAVLRVDQLTVRPALRHQRRLIGVQIEGPKLTMFSPHGTLTRDELDVVEMHGASLSLLASRLLPEGPVRVGDSWEHPDDILAALLGLDAISQAEVQTTFSRVTGGTAQLEMGGHVAGAVGGVSTEIQLKAKYYFDLETERITWFGLLVKEDRSIGHVGPGLEVVARLQMEITPAEESVHLKDSVLAGLSLEPTAELTQLSYESPEGGWRLVHDRRWFINSDEASLAVLRMIDRGEFVAQCNVHVLPKAEPGKPIDLAQFQDDIKHGLGDNFKQFVQAGQRNNESGYRVYRVVVAGEAEQLPIQWIYYLVGDKHGRQVVLAFTVEGSLVGRFDGADEQLVATLRFGDLEDPENAAGAERQSDASPETEPIGAARRPSGRG